MSDYIDRQAAIDALTRKMVSIPTAGEKDLMGDVNRIRAEDISVIRRLPSAQPEQLTDKEQRIFLAAMGREEKVCKQVDDECRDCREPYEDSLVRTCHEITRKVKGALWV